MYTFDDRGGRSLTLRPEGTAGVMRASSSTASTAAAAGKLWYSGPFFRAERPQQGRYRHFSRSASRRSAPTTRPLDAEVIAIADERLPLRSA